MALAQMAKSLNDGAAFTPGGGDIARSGVLEDDFALAEFDAAGSGSIGQENEFSSAPDRKGRGHYWQHRLRPVEAGQNAAG